MESFQGTSLWSWRPVGWAVDVTVSIVGTREKTAIRHVKVSNLETVSEVDVQDFAAQSIQHQVGRMPEGFKRENRPAAVLLIV